MPTEKEIYLERVVETLSKTVSDLTETNRKLYWALNNVTQKLNTTVEYVKEELRDA